MSVAVCGLEFLAIEFDPWFKTKHFCNHLCISTTSPLPTKTSHSLSVDCGFILSWRRAKIRKGFIIMEQNICQFKTGMKKIFLAPQRAVESGLELSKFFDYWVWAVEQKGVGCHNQTT